MAINLSPGYQFKLFFFLFSRPYNIGEGGVEPRITRTTSCFLPTRLVGLCIASFNMKDQLTVAFDFFFNTNLPIVTYPNAKKFPLCLTLDP